MYQLFNIIFLRPSSLKKVAVSSAHCDEKDDISRTYRNRDRGIFGEDEDEESYDSTVQCGDNCFALIRKHQQVVVPVEVEVEAAAADVRGNNDAIEVIHSVSSVANEMLRTHGVRFIDEMFSMNSHIVTDTHYRPETTKEEKALLYYCSEDYERFALEDWCWRASKEIRMQQNLQEQDQEEESLKNEEDTTGPPISRVRRHHDLARENALVV